MSYQSLNNSSPFQFSLCNTVDFYKAAIYRIRRICGVNIRTYKCDIYSYLYFKNKMLLASTTQIDLLQLAPHCVTCRSAFHNSSDILAEYSVKVFLKRNVAIGGTSVRGSSIFDGSQGTNKIIKLCRTRYIPGLKLSGS